MTVPAPAAPAAHVRESAPLVRWWGWMLRTPARMRLWWWAGPALVTLLALVLRVWGLGHPHDLVFDETYYVKDAFSLLHLGFEAKWPEDANARFIAGDTNVFLPQASYVVHPPLGKWIIALGMMAFGAEQAWAWRITTALLGAAGVLLVTVIGRRLTGSTLLGVIAGFLMAIDGVAIVMSRVALLDNSLMFFVLLAFLFLLNDRERMQSRITRVSVGTASTAGSSAGGFSAGGSSLGGSSAEASPRGASPPGASPSRTSASGTSLPAISREWGPVVWARPWVLAAGAALGAACAVKWSGAYVLAGVGIYLVVTDLLARRRAGIGAWATDGILRQAPVTFLQLVPVALVVYLASWTGWLVTDGGYDRQSAANAPATGLWSWVPLSLQSLWRYHQSMYSFHVGLTAEHSYEAPAWSWPLLMRPTFMYWNNVPEGDDGCALWGGCTQSITSVSNPLIWWVGIAAALYLISRFVITRDWRIAFVLTGLAVTYLPWLQYGERTVFQFYTVVMIPFVALALMLVAQQILGPRDGPAHRRSVGIAVIVVFLVAATLISAFFYPVWTGMEIPYRFWVLHNWLPSWV